MKKFFAVTSCVWQRAQLRCRRSQRFAAAQAYPVRPVRMIVGFPAGSAPDIIARLIGQWLSEDLGQPFRSITGRAPPATSRPNPP